MIIRLRKEEGITVSVDNIFKYPTLESFCKYLEEPAKYSKLFISDKSEGIIFNITDYKDIAYDSPLYLIHEGIGIIQPYFNLKNIITNPLYALEDPYIGKEKSGFSDIHSMINYYTESIKKHHMKYHFNKPISIAGWSFGGIIAYEIAIILTELLEVDNLIIIDSYIPIATDSTQNAIFNNKQSNNPHVNRNSKLLINYKMTRNYNSKLTVIKAKINSHMNIQSNLNLINRYYGWDNLAKEVVAYEADGNHYTLFDRDNISSIGKILNTIMCN